MNSADLNLDDQLLIQRLVDRELDEAGQRALLVRCEACPTMWRALALAFVEQQVWDDGITTGAGWREEAIEPSLEAAIESPAKLPPEAQSSERGARLIKLGKWLASLAAMLIVGVVIGHQVVGRWAWNSNKHASNPGTNLPTKGGEANDPFFWLTVDSPEGEQTLKVPVLAENDASAGDVLQHRNLLRDDVLRRLNEQGYEVQQERDLVPLPLPDGHKMIMPVDRFRVQNVGYLDFQ